MSSYIPSRASTSQRASTSPFNTPSSIANLPAEIRDQIVDHLHDHQPTLSALALTSRAFRPSSQYHLFSSVTLGTRTAFEAFTTALSLAPHLARFVEKLTISEGRPEHAGSGDWVDDWLPSFPAAGTLPRLHTLSLELLAWDFLAPATHEALHTRFPGVRALRLRDCVFGEFSDLRKLVGAFSKLDTFDAAFCQWRAGGSMPIGGAIPRLKEVTLAGCPQGVMAQWLLQTPSQLRSIVSRDTGEDSLSCVGALTRAAGDQLEHLHLSTWYHWDHNRERNEWLPDSLTLSHNTQLRTLRVDVPFLGRDGRWVPQLLATAKSPALESLTLDMFLEKREDLDEFDWERARGAFSPERMPGLRSLEFIVRGKAVALDEVSSVLRERLPVLAQRGVLEVHGGASR